MRTGGVPRHVDTWMVYSIKQIVKCERSYKELNTRRNAYLGW